MLRRQLLAVITLCNPGVASSAHGINNEVLARSSAAVGAAPEIDDGSEEPLAQGADEAKTNLHIENHTPPVPSVAALQDAPQRSQRELAEATSYPASVVELQAALANPTVDRIILAAGTYTITSISTACSSESWLCVDRAVTIEAAEAGTVVLDAKRVRRVFYITGTGVQLAGLIITGGYTPSWPGVLAFLNPCNVPMPQYAGPANPPSGLEAHKGAWVVAMEVDVAAMAKVLIETIDPTTLLAHPNATAPPATTDALTTMRLSVGGKQLAAGEHKLSIANAAAAVSAKRVGSKRRIGSGWVEQITITADGLKLRITSAKANKFADEQHQVLGLHLDVEFLTFDQSAVRGALPEMWGLQPMTEKTKELLDKESADN